MIEGWYDDETLELDYKSCEMMARNLLSNLYYKYPDRSIEVTVSEDGENGATVKKVG